MPRWSSIANVYVNLKPDGMTPSAHKIQRSNESIFGTNLASSALEVHTMANASMEDDTFDADESLVADENLGSDNLTMDGNNSADENLSEDENSGAGENPSENDIDADDRSDGNADATSSSESHSDDRLDHETIRMALDQMGDIITENEELNQQARKDDDQIVRFKLKAKLQAESMKKMETDFDHRVKILEDEILRLRRDMRQKADCDIIKADRDTIKEANKHMRLCLDEAKAQLRKEVYEKADYHRIKEERTEYHLEFIKKTKECKDLEKQNSELRRKLNMEASFPAQAMAMFSKKPEI